MTCWDNKMFRHFVLRYEARNVFWHVTFANSPNEISLNFSQRNHLDAVSPNSKIIPQTQIWILPSSIVFFGHFWMFLANLSYFTNLGFPVKIQPDFPSLATCWGPRSCEVAMKFDQTSVPNTGALAQLR